MPVTASLLLHVGIVGAIVLGPGWMPLRRCSPATSATWSSRARATVGRTFGAATALHADRWTITACPHRGGQVSADPRGRLYAVWYTEGTGGRPDVLFATAPDGRRFGPP